MIDLHRLHNTVASIRLAVKKNEDTVNFPFTKYPKTIVFIHASRISMLQNVKKKTTISLKRQQLCIQQKQQFVASEISFHLLFK